MALGISDRTTTTTSHDAKGKNQHNKKNTTQEKYKSGGVASKGLIWDNHTWHVYMMMFYFITMFPSMPKGDIVENMSSLEETEINWWRMKTK